MGFHPPLSWGLETSQHGAYSAAGNSLPGLCLTPHDPVPPSPSSPLPGTRLACPSAHLMRSLVPL